MIKKIYFWDGKLDNGMWNIPEEREDWLPSPDAHAVIVEVNAADGYSFNNSQLEYFKKSEMNFIVKTNQITALDFHLFGLELDGFTGGRIYLYNKREQRWLPIESFTDKNLLVPHNIAQMYREGVFCWEGK